MRDREIVERVRDATDLLALVGQAVKLRKQGSAHVGLCPFHAERSPSFQVVANRGFYHCFGCGKHGDAFAWLMEREGMTFPEALEQLARAAGIDLPQHRERPSAEVDLETRMRSALDAAQAFFEAQLARHDGARAYLRDRGYAGAFLSEAGFGVAPDAWDALVNHLRGLNFSGELLEQAGLASRSERGTQIDFLRNRLTIPIHDARGRVVAFGGRIMGEAPLANACVRQSLRSPPQAKRAGARKARDTVGASPSTSTPATPPSSTRAAPSSASTAPRAP